MKTPRTRPTLVMVLFATIFCLLWLTTVVFMPPGLESIDFVMFMFSLLGMASLLMSIYLPSIRLSALAILTLWSFVFTVDLFGTSATIEKVATGAGSAFAAHLAFQSVLLLVRKAIVKLQERWK